ncbi:MAG TPA: LamG domain-containing protein [Thermoanaerobaculia bacterium]|nr:LamG domain-containing protein [Thermoanaerobaculia bacterium]
MLNWWGFDETAGPTAADYVGNLNDGAYAASPNDPSPASGLVSNALDLDGNDYLTVPDDDEIDLSNRPKSGPFKFCSYFAIDAWIKTSHKPGVNVILDKRVEPSKPVGYSLFLYNGRLGFQMADGKPAGSACGPEATHPCSNYVAPGPNVADGTWHLIAVTVQVHGSGTACPEIGKLYVDGNVVHTFVPRTHSLSNGNLPGSDIANSADLSIGRRAPAFGGGGYFKGLIDELEFFNARNVNASSFPGALTQAHIQAIHNAGSAGKCP